MSSQDILQQKLKRLGAGDPGAQERLRNKLLAVNPKLQVQDFFLPSELPPQDWYPSGVGILDQFLGGGLPVGRVVEFYGPKGVGKSTLSLLFKPKLYVSTERDIDRDWVSRFSPDTEFVFPKTAEQALEIVQAGVLSNVPIVVLDSVASLVPEDELSGKSSVGLLPRVLNAHLRRILPFLDRTCLLFVNQVRAVMNHPGVLDSPGGEYLKHMCSMRIEFRPAGEWVTAGDKKVGHGVRLLLTKNKLGVPQRSIVLYLSYAGSWHTSAVECRLAWSKSGRND